jgi:hypothetical protein
LKPFTQKVIQNVRLQLSSSDLAVQFVIVCNVFPMVAVTTRNDPDVGRRLQIGKTVY